MNLVRAGRPTGMALEGEAKVPGGILRFRASGTASPAPWLVFENGWGVSFPHLYYVERELAPYARLLFYDRAGIGGSRRTLPVTVPRLTEQFVALLAHLQIHEPVVVVGQSFGGLMAALHAAQAPTSVRSIVQIDPTPEVDDPVIDANLATAPKMIAVLKIFARLRLPNLVFQAIAGDLPADVVARVGRDSFQSSRSLDAAREELDLLPEMRRCIARRDTPRKHARLVISADRGGAGKSRLLRLLVSDERARGMLDGMQSVHRSQAKANLASRWLPLPHSHSGLVMTAAGTAEVARETRSFIA